MLLNVDQLQKQLDKDEFSRSMAPSNDKHVYSSLNTLESGGFNIFQRYTTPTPESTIDTGKALDADLVNTASIRTDSIVQDDSSRSENDTYADDADIRPIYDERPKKVFNSCTTKVDSEPPTPHGSNCTISRSRNIYVCKQTLDLRSAWYNHSMDKSNEQRIDLSVGATYTNVKRGKNSEYGLLKKMISQKPVAKKSYALSWKPCQGDSLNLPDHRAQVDQGSQIKMIQVKEMMQDNDLKNSKSKDKGSKSRSQSMDEQSHYKQDKTITRQSINVKRHIFNVIGGTEEFEERDLNIGGDC
ncbi:hypothetical protein Tco_0890735 [Tanacetum coccineum]|uniref:Uncharacterized protein n=1 Tax=Tanacetum coccineum TaxID=301880 RepID=A0ABQ5C2H5_9ASTR